MKKFLFRLIVFLFVPALICGYVEKRLYDMPTSYSVKSELMESMGEEAEVINTGNSHAFNAINPYYFSAKGINLAGPAQSIFYDRAILEKNMDRFRHLKLVIIPLSYISLWYDMHDTDDRWRTYFYVRSMDIHHPDDRWYDIKNYSMIFLYEPLTALKLASGGFKQNYSARINSWGCKLDTLLPGQMFISDSIVVARMEMHHKRFSEKRFRENCAYLDELISSLTHNRIKVVLTQLPVTRICRDRFRDDVIARNDSVKNVLVNKWKIRYVNFADDTAFTNADFYDVDHLNSTGAEKISRLINDSIVIPSLAQSGFDQ